MDESADLLIEIGTEELPPAALRGLSEAFARRLGEALAAESLAHGAVSAYATPRRLAVLVTELQSSQPERQTERRGPALAEAFDAGGRPTRAALGFAGACGVEVEHLERLETPQGSWLVFRTTEVGQTTVSLMPALVERVLAELPVPRRMRWNELDVEFVRPVHWVVMMFGEEVIEAELLGVSSGRHTRGHRFHQTNPLPVESPSGYAMLLYGSGHVIADFETRSQMVRKMAEASAAELGGRALIDDALLEEVTALVEWPVAVAGSFDGEFLELPAQVLVATMRDHQRSFPVVDAEGRLMPNFIAISNIDSTRPETVQRGYERVIRPRLKDAAFFYRTDMQRALEDRLEGLREVIFQEKLGTLYDKSQRVSRLAAHTAIAIGESPDAVKLARRAGLLSKCDLLTEMVGEFPELQGYMGREYGLRSGEPEAVAVAIEESYRPRFARDRIPETGVGRAVAIADRLDTLVGIFGTGSGPSGDKDPYGLRRAALGVLRIVIEGELDIDLRKLLAAAAEQHGQRVDAAVPAQVFEFMIERLRAYFGEQGVPPDVFAAVAARGATRPFDFARRVRAVDEFRRLPEAASLAAANKRIRNILKQVDDGLPDKVDDGLFSEDAEWNLAAKVVGLGPRVRDMLRNGDYSGALRHLAGLRESVDAFFDTVKVMDDREAVRNNRLALLYNISDLFMETADISLLQSVETD